VTALGGSRGGALHPSLGARNSLGFRHGLQLFGQVTAMGLWGGCDTGTSGDQAVSSSLHLHTVKQTKILDGRTDTLYGFCW
jgi:hypothetical protein